jgi:hypothetical protein
VLQFILPTKIMSVIDIFKFVEYADCYLNMSIANRVLLAVFVTERKISKLKLIKTYLRSSISQERFNGLTTLSIKKDMLENIDVDVIINDYASQNARKNNFL